MKHQKITEKSGVSLDYDLLDFITVCVCCMVCMVCMEVSPGLKIQIASSSKYSVDEKEFLKDLIHKKNRIMKKVPQ